ncbi:MAG: oxygenase MpaB family protein [Acidimicrobiia bacterium]
MADRFPASAPVRRLNSEPAVMAAAGRALLLQLAHPAVAQGVHDHSDFKTNPFTRLQGTLESVNAVVFGTEALAQRVGQRLRWIHGFITGPGYSANDPANLLWVHATLVDSALWAIETLLGPIDPDVAETYYQQMKEVAEVFGVPLDAQPPTLADFRRYVDEQVGAVELTPVAHDLIGWILDPTLPLGLHVPLQPLRRRFRLITLGSLPEPIRAQLDEPWDEARQRRYERSIRCMRLLFRRLPAPMRTGPLQLSNPLMLRRARRTVRAFEERRAARSAPAA